MEELLVEGETCLTYGKASHEKYDLEECRKEIASHIQTLQDRVTNDRIGMAGHENLKRIMWSRERDTESLTAFFSRCFWGK